MAMDLLWQTIGDAFKDYDSWGNYGWKISTEQIYYMNTKKDGWVVYEVPLAGYSEEDVEVSCEKNKIFIDVKKRENKNGGNMSFPAKKFELADREGLLDLEGLRAEFKDGVLLLLVPPKTKVERKKISLSR